MLTYFKPGFVEWSRTQLNFVFLRGFSGATRRSGGHVRFSMSNNLSLCSICLQFVLYFAAEHMEQWLELPGQEHPVFITDHNCASRGGGGSLIPHPKRQTKRVPQLITV